MTTSRGGRRGERASLPPTATKTARRRWRWTSWPRRTLWPTRDGWWCLAASIGLGFAAMNTGNNLLYLLVSMLLGLIIVSGMLSEQSIRGLHFVPIVPDEVFAGRPALFGIRVMNRKRWRSSYSLVIEVVDGTATRRSAHLARLDPGAEQLVTWDATLPVRGRQPFPRLRVTTRFPFGLFVKAGQVELATDVVVFPPVHPVSAAHLRQLTAGGTAVRRRGRGTDLHNLREYRPGDDPRFIHWRSSAKGTELLIREFEADTTLEVRLTLEGRGADPGRLETGLSEAASIASHLLRTGGAVELAGPAIAVPLGEGREHRIRVLTALALYDPAGSPPPRSSGRRAAAREIRVAIG